MTVEVAVGLNVLPHDRLPNWGRPLVADMEEAASPYPLLPSLDHWLGDLSVG
ncbi:MAG: hypothetical protein H7Z11_20895 [Verrucomicrobia bacterium]|nr:hypothetical protein [Leptolyngbya sp. ES-bin-22]